VFTWATAWWPGAPSPSTKTARCGSEPITAPWNGSWEETSFPKAQIANYREDVNTVMYGNLKKYIDQFSSGWVAYLSPANLKDNKEKCLQLKKEFEDKHGIKSGTVKVVAKRLEL
jgi:hypothetical protein